MAATLRCMKNIFGLEDRSNATTTSNLQCATPGSFLDDHKKVLNRALSPWQVYLMMFSGVVGTGVFVNGGYALSVAGPAGAAFGFVFVGIIVFCVVQPMSEMLTIFPVTNPVAELVRSFLDEDLAIMIEAGYWLVYAALFNAMVVSAVNLLGMSTNSNDLVRVLVTCAVFVILIAFNQLPVRTYGHVEALLGALKIGSIIVIMVLVSYAASVSPAPRPEINFGGAFGSDGFTTHSNVQAVFSTISLAVFPYIGVEAVATMSGEAFKESEVVPYMSTLPPTVAIISVILCAISGLVVGRQDPRLSAYTSQGLGGVALLSRQGPAGFENIPPAIIVMQIGNLGPKAVNLLLVFSAISSANTSLYVSSRALFGAAQRYTFDIKYTNLTFEGLGRVSPRTRVPVMSVALAFTSLLWLTIINLVSDSDHWNIVQLATNAASISVIIIWASQCIVFLRFNHFRSLYNKEYSMSLEIRQTTKPALMATIHCWQAWIGLLGCVVLYVSGTAFLWGHPSETIDYRLTIAGIVLPLLVLIVCYLLLKGRRALCTRRDTLSMYVDFKDWPSFKSAVLALRSQIHPTGYPVRADSLPPPLYYNKMTREYVSSRSDEENTYVEHDAHIQNVAHITHVGVPGDDPMQQKPDTLTEPIKHVSLKNGPVIVTRRERSAEFSRSPSKSLPLQRNSLEVAGSAATAWNSTSRSSSSRDVLSTSEVEIIITPPDN